MPGNDMKKKSRAGPFPEVPELAHQESPIVFAATAHGDISAVPQSGVFGHLNLSKKQHLNRTIKYILIIY